MTSTYSCRLKHRILSWQSTDWRSSWPSPGTVMHRCKDQDWNWRLRLESKTTASILTRSNARPLDRQSISRPIETVCFNIIAVESREDKLVCSIDMQKHQTSILLRGVYSGDTLQDFGERFNQHLYAPHVYCTYKADISVENIQLCMYVYCIRLR